MPVYEYRCRTCDTTFEVRRPMSESSAAVECPEGHEALRVLSVFASVGSSPSAGPTPAPSGAPCGSHCACH
jgi:putative FmdB family regulatory protein